MDLDGLTARVDAVLNEDLYWFPVRHHSPAIATQIAECVHRRRPRVVFIEGPSEAQDMIEFLVDAKTRPPVAIYSSFRDDASATAAANVQPGNPPRYSAWYPLVSYSPDLVAMRSAKEVGAKAVFMDLPHYALMRPDPIEARRTSEEGGLAHDNPRSKSNASASLALRAPMERSPRCNAAATCMRLL